MSISFPASHADLLESQVAALSTIDDAVFPQTSLVWFLFEDGQLKLSLNTDRAKVRFLRERPRCSLTLIDFENPYRYLEVRGTVRLEPDDGYAFAERVGAKYGADLRTFDQPGDTRLVAVIDPVKIHAVAIGG